MSHFRFEIDGSSHSLKLFSRLVNLQGLAGRSFTGLENALVVDPDSFQIFCNSFDLSHNGLEWLRIEFVQNMSL